MEDYIFKNDSYILSICSSFSIKSYNNKFVKIFMDNHQQEQGDSRKLYELVLGE